MHIVLVDGISIGHHAFYTSAFAQVLADLGCRVTILCPNAKNISELLSPDYTNAGVEIYLYAEKVEKLHSYAPKGLQTIWHCLKRWIKLRRALKNIHTADFIFFGWLDSYLNAYIPGWFIDFLVPIKWSGLYFHPLHHRQISHPSYLKKLYQRPAEKMVITSRYSTGLAILDAGISNKMENSMGGAKPLFVFPDFSDEVAPDNRSLLVTKILQRANGRKIVVLLGSLAKRKGVMTLIDVAINIRDENIFFVLAGQLVESTFTADELIKLNQACELENCWISLQHIQDDAEFNGILSVSDVVFAAYHDFPHSSNLVTKAAKYKKPILVSIGGYMQEVVESHSLGFAVPPGDVKKTIQALGILLGRDIDNSQSASAEYLEKQSIDTLKIQMSALLEVSLKPTKGC